MRYLGGKVIGIWQKEDVLEAARQRGINLTATESETVLFYMAKYYDAAIGCNWFYIQNIIDVVKRRGGVTAEVLNANVDDSIKI